MMNFGKMKLQLLRRLLIQDSLHVYNKKKSNMQGIFGGSKRLAQ